MTPDATLVGSFDYRLVALSVVIAILSAYAALDLGGRVTATRGRRRLLWLTGGATAMGMGIWAMHYIGMLAYSLPVIVLYDWPTVLLSLLAAIFASAIALFVVSRREMGSLSIGIGGLLMGSGIAAMHYIGMEAMRLPAMCHYSPAVVLLSVGLAIVISLVALWITFHLRSETNAISWRKPASALLMGAAIPIMHYTGMAAVTYVPMASEPDGAHAIGISAIGIAGIASVSLLILGLTILTSLVDRRFSAQSLELEKSEERYRQLVESAQVILWRSSLDAGDFSFVNHESETLLGYSVHDWLATRDFWLLHVKEEDRALVRSNCEAVAQNKGPRQFEHRMIGKASKVLWLRTSVCLVDGNGKQELVGVMTDITARKQAQEAAEEANRANGAFLGEIRRLNEQLQKENSRMSAELEITQRLQQMMLPREDDLRRIPNLDISGFMEPAAEVGGDYFDVVQKDESVVFGIGDVTGHGLESGVIAIMVQTAVRTLIASGLQESREFFPILNKVVYDNVRRMNCDRNLTFSLLNYRDKLVTISGQHEEILVVRNDGAFERHDTLNLGFPLGLEDDISRLVGEAKVPLCPGDVMVAYTDGITEAANSHGVSYGVERLAEVLRANHNQAAAHIRQAVVNNLREHVQGKTLLDDISLLVIKAA